MSLIIDRRTVLLGMSATLAMPKLAMAQETVHEILMLNEHPDDSSIKMVFHPLVTVGQAGDTFKFVSTDKGHNTVSIKGAIPDGAQKWKSKINKDFELTLEVPGVYGFQCVPHTAMGMVGLIVVQGEGMTDNVEAAKSAKIRGSRAKKVWEQIWAEVEEKNLLAPPEESSS